MNMKTFQYRIYPTKAQETALSSVIDACRWVYNHVLESRKAAWETEGKTLSYNDTTALLPGWKNEHNFLKRVYSQILQNACTRVDLAMKAFFRRSKSGDAPGFPRFRGQNRYDSFTFPQKGFNLTNCDKLDMSKIGRVKIVLHRPIEGKIKTLTIKKTPTGKWFANFVCEIETVVLPVNHNVVGVDMGLTKFATFSNGESIENPRFFKKAEKSLAKVQRRLSKETKGTLERRFRCRAVALTHEKIANKRKDFAHKLSHRLVMDFGTLFFEDLNIKKMVQGFLVKGIHDVAWNQLIQFTTNKAECAGRLLILVNPSNTSKMCSKCGTLVEKDLSIRVHKCPSCGLVIDRDHNAALNILRLGLESLATHRSPNQKVGE